MASPNQTKVNLWQPKYTSPLVKGLCFAGIGFLLICAIGIGLFFAFETILTAINNQNNSNLLLGIMIGMIVLILLSSIMQMIVFWRWTRCSKTFIYIVTAIYIIAQGVGFGILFWTFQLMFQQNWIPCLLGVFGVAGLILLIVGLIGIRLSMKQTMTFGRLLGWATLVFFMIAIVFSIVSIIVYFTTSGGTIAGMDWWYFIMIGFSGLLIIGYLAWDMSMLSKISCLTDDQQTQSKLALLFGFKLLVDFIALIWQIARIVMIARRLKK